MKLLSVIVPMYNVEPYVERCIRSLEDQDISSSEFEIICINDGSPDNCHRVVEGLKAEYPNIVLIDQDNQGVSGARNNGIERAEGKYILFIDPDDYVDPNCFAHIIKEANEYRAEVSFLGFSVLNENGEVRNRVFDTNHSEKVFKGTEAYFLSRGDGQTDPDRMWAVLFKTDFLNNNKLRFLPGVPYLEDGELIARILARAERCIFDGCSFYQRTTRMGSATNSRLFHSEKATIGFLLAAENLKKFRQEQNLSEKQKIFLNQPIVKFVLLAINSCLSRESIKRFKTTANTLLGISLGKLDLRGCNRKFCFFGAAYNLSPWLAALALTIYPRMNGKYLSSIIRKNLLRK